MHEVTHLPFAAWCEACLETKSREDRTVQNKDAEVEDPGVPHIQMDWMYLGRSCPSLILLDTTSRYGAIFPARTKGVWRALAEFCVKFSLGLNYLGEVVYVMDSEPATLGLLDMIVMIRQAMGYKTLKKAGKPYHKGRTARVERYIQTVRRQACTLMACVEDNIHEVLDDHHCLRAWALVHSVFLLNRFHEHVAIRATAFETVFGQKYSGKLVPFGEFVFGLRQPMKKRGTSVWQGGVWIGKDENDMHVLLTAGGQFHTRSIRRCSHSWRPDVILSLTSYPWSKHKSSGPVGILEAPMPVIQERTEGPDPREPILLKTGEVDEDAEAVRDQQDVSYEPTEVGSDHGQGGGRHALVEEPLERLSDVQRKSLLGIPVIPSTPTQQIEVDQEGQPGEKRNAEEGPEEDRDTKAARFERADSPSSSPKAGLYAPLYAGGVNRVDMPHGDVCWETEIDWESIEAELEDIEPDAMKIEVQKLTEMGVVQVLDEQDMDPSGKFIDLKEAYDWRFREGRWKRRCRIVAREFRTGPTTDETFSPTSSYSVVRLFLFCHLFFGWKVASLDISDAYLTVTQKEVCYVKISDWMKELLQLPESSLWQLKRVLPGQRNGAQRWFHDFSRHLQALGFVSCIAMPSVLKHQSRKLAINIHVDDELVVGEKLEDIDWVIEELKKIYRLQVEGPIPKEPLGSGGELSYLKKVYVFQQDGIYVRPNSKFTDTLIKLYGLQDRKEKQVPEHGLLGRPDTSPELSNERQASFRTGLGTAMYMSHERLDIQHCVKTLAGSMRTPTEQAERCLIQLCLYLKNTADLSFRLPYIQVGTRMSGRLNNRPEHEIEDGVHVMEIFCDSDWAGNVNRRSTTSVVILLNSLVVLSYSRTQKAVSLSSCEAEVLALTSGASEAMLLKEVWMFMVGQETLLEARSDSSSGRQWLQRAGLGRLKHIDVRLCWLQQAVHDKILQVLPVSTQVNIADLNTKKLTASRRQFLLSFMGAVRLNDENEVIEEIGEREQMNYFSEQQWKNQVRQVSRWMKNKAVRQMVQCSLFVQAMSMKGCAEDGASVNVEQDSQQQLYLTLLVLMLVALCNWVYNHWNELAARFGPRGRKRRMSERDEEEPDPEGRREVISNDNIEPGTSSSAAPATATTNSVEPRPPQIPPMPADPPARWEVWSPEWFTYWMLGRVQRRLERRAGRMTELERKKYEKRREILRSTLAILEQNPGEVARRRAHYFCQSMTDLSVDDESPRAPEVPELPEPGAEPEAGLERLNERMDEYDGYFRSSRVPGRSIESLVDDPQAINRPDRDEEGEDEGGGTTDAESEDTRVARYLNSTLDEVSDPEMWMGIHHYSSDSSDVEMEEGPEQPSGSTGH